MFHANDPRRVHLDSLFAQLLAIARADDPCAVGAEHDA